MALKFKNPFGSGTTRGIIAGKRFRELKEQERKRRRDFQKLQGKPRRKIGKRA